MSGALETIKKEWSVIRGAPWSFIFVTATIAATIFAFINYVNSATIAAKDATIQTLTAAVTSYKDKLNGASPDEAKGKITQLESRLKEFESSLEGRIKNIEPRHLSEDQKRIIKSYINTISGEATIATELGCGECIQYADEFQSTLQNSGWKVRLSLGALLSAASPTGIAVIIPNNSNKISNSIAIINSLRDANIAFVLKEPNNHNTPSLSDHTDAVTMIITPRK